MNDNYPPGVTGNEPQIVGWPACPKCGDDFDGVVCPCGFNVEAEKEYAADRKYDEMRESGER